MTFNQIVCAQIRYPKSCLYYAWIKFLRFVKLIIRMIVCSYFISNFSKHMYICKCHGIRYTILYMCTYKFIQIIYFNTYFINAVCVCTSYSKMRKQYGVFLRVFIMQKFFAFIIVFQDLHIIGLDESTLWNMYIIMYISLARLKM